MDEYDKKRQTTPEYKAQKRKYYKERRWYLCQQNNARRKLEVFTHYSHGSPRCEYCGETDMRCLCLDHIKGDGAKHRKEIRGSGTAVYNWVIKNNFPPGLQVLCANCNYRKRFVEGREGQFW